VIPYEPTEAERALLIDLIGKWSGYHDGSLREAVEHELIPIVAARYYEQALTAAYDRIARPDVRGVIQAMKALRELGAAGVPAGEPQ
jgi:hypothetical protein